MAIRRFALAALLLVCGQAMAGQPPITAAGLAGSGLIATSNNQIQTYTPVRTIALTSYTMQSTDGGSELHFTSSSAISVSLPAADAAGFTAGYSVTIEGDYGSGLITVTPTSGTINGGASLLAGANTGCTISSDGANWRVSGCTALTPGATGSGITQLTGDVTAGPGNGSQAATVVRIGGVTPGTAVGYSVGISGGVLGLLNTANTISGANTYTALQAFAAGISLNNGTAANPALYFGTNTGIFGSNSTLDASVQGALKGCFVGAGFVVAASCGTDTVNGQTPGFQVRNNSSVAAANSSLLAAYQASVSAGASVYCAHSRSNTLGTQAAVVSGDALCYRYDVGSDGTAFQLASLVETLVDGAVSSGVVPGRIVIGTANAAGVMTEGMRINSAQHVSFSGAAPTISGGTLDAYASDNEGTITASAASLSVTFAKAFLVYARCLPTSEAGLTLTYSFSLTGLTVSATGLSGTKVDYQCHGQ